VRHDNVNYLTMNVQTNGREPLREGALVAKDRSLG
jgi:hypothetical protein